MASSLEFVEYVCEQMKDAGIITYKKMFGEYGIYLNGKIFALVCDDQLFIKITNAGKSLVPNITEAPPYQGSKPYFVIDFFEDHDLITEFVKKTCEELPEPKPKKKVLNSNNKIS